MAKKVSPTPPPPGHHEYHLTWCAPNEHWPKGAWSLYRITGERIAQSLVYERVNPKGWYEGDVIYSHPWCGYLGLFVTLAEVTAKIEEDKNTIDSKQ